MRRLLWACLGLAASCGAALSWLAKPPDFDLALTREVESRKSPSELAEALGRLSLWPSWHFMMREATITDPGGKPIDPQPALAAGRSLKLVFLPKGREWKRFDLKARVADYAPGRALEIRLEEDSKGKLTRLFERLEWRIELIPSVTGSLIRATVSARTHHWRSRLIGRVVPKVMLNQVLYPHLDRLAGAPEPPRLKILPE